MDEPKTNLSRRVFLGTVLGTGAIASLASCSKRLPRYLVPENKASEDAIPGVARFYSTVCRECPAACGMTVRVREGRAVKLEGNTKHPTSGGSLCLRGQAAIEDLYAVDRLGAPLVAGAGAALVAASWDAAEDKLAAGLRAAMQAKKKIVVLTRPEPGALGTLFRNWLVALGQDANQVVTFDPMQPTWIREGAKRAFAIDQQPVYELGRARTLLSVGADFLEDWGSPVEYARALADLRGTGSRFVYVGPRLSLTSGAADEWISTKPGTEGEVVLGLARAALERGGPGVDSLSRSSLERLRSTLAPFTVARVAARTGVAQDQLKQLSDSFLSARPSLCVGPGRAVTGTEPATLAEAVHLLNALAGNLNQTVHFDEASSEPWTASGMTLDELTAKATAGEVGALVVHHANPLGFGPVLGQLAKAFSKIPMLATFVNRPDETSRQATVVLPDHHFLEAWGEVIPRSGIRGLQQPAMTPVRPTRAAGTVLLELAHKLEAPNLPDPPFDTLVRQATTEADLERGGVFTTPTYRTAALVETVLSHLPAEAKPASATSLAVVVAPSVRYLDGLVPQGGLLQEVPDPLTTIAWGGWAELHPSTAARLGVTTGDGVRVQTAAGETELAAYVYAGVREDVVGIPVPYAASLHGNTAGAVGQIGSAQVTATGKKVTLAMTAGSISQRGRGLAQEVVGGASLPRKSEALSMYPEVEHPEHRWAMAIDLDKCTGCAACVGACYVENNSPIVGPEEIARGRDMAWLRVERFIEGPASHPRAIFLPLMCQHCGHGPCESVCPVYATYHSAEGLNTQVYNRCVGTRYCDNNCPYGVRRFNWSHWPRPEPSNQGLNPDVTVRDRGVMEKCTLCVHRIRGAKEEARTAGRPLKDGDFAPACAQTCPSQAIVFGDLKDASSRVAQAAAAGRAYRLLDELNTRPGISYLARRREETPT
jgi:Fe-S-cluster-containing dehydrogenase component/anaerobic selenocysteine-containing dehydrogenase